MSSFQPADLRWVLGAVVFQEGDHLGLPKDGVFSQPDEVAAFFDGQQGRGGEFVGDLYGLRVGAIAVVNGITMSVGMRFFFRRPAFGEIIPGGINSGDVVIAFRGGARSGVRLLAISIEEFALLRIAENAVHAAPGGIAREFGIHHEHELGSGPGDHTAQPGGPGRRAERQGRHWPEGTRVMN